VLCNAITFLNGLFDPQGSGFPVWFFVLEDIHN
jgi:hypothetical protein